MGRGDDTSSDEEEGGMVDDAPKPKQREPEVVRQRRGSLLGDNAVAALEEQKVVRQDERVRRASIGGMGGFGLGGPLGGAMGGGGRV